MTTSSTWAITRSARPSSFRRTAACSACSPTASRTDLVAACKLFSQEFDECRVHDLGMLVMGNVGRVVHHEKLRLRDGVAHLLVHLKRHIGIVLAPNQQDRDVAPPPG